MPRNHHGPFACEIRANAISWVTRRPCVGRKLHRRQRRQSEGRARCYCIDSIGTSYYRAGNGVDIGSGAAPVQHSRPKEHPHALVTRRALQTTHGSIYGIGQTQMQWSPQTCRRSGIPSCYQIERVQLHRA